MPLVKQVYCCNTSNFCSIVPILHAATEAKLRVLLTYHGTVLGQVFSESGSCPIAHHYSEMSIHHWNWVKHQDKTINPVYIAKTSDITGAGFRLSRAIRDPECFIPEVYVTHHRKLIAKIICNEIRI